MLLLRSASDPCTAKKKSFEAITIDTMVNGPWTAESSRVHSLHEAIRARIGRQCSCLLRCWSEVISGTQTFY